MHSTTDRVYYSKVTGERGYTGSGSQSQAGREDISGVGANHRHVVSAKNGGRIEFSSGEFAS
eukprot:5639629-Pyramimonas_sp.AAC.1